MEYEEKYETTIINKKKISQTCFEELIKDYWKNKIEEYEKGYYLWYDYWIKYLINIF